MYFWSIFVLLKKSFASKSVGGLKKDVKMIISTARAPEHRSRTLDISPAKIRETLFKQMTACYSACIFFCVEFG